MFEYEIFFFKKMIKMNRRILNCVWQSHYSIESFDIKFFFLYIDISLRFIFDVIGWERNYFFYILSEKMFKEYDKIILWSFVLHTKHTQTKIKIKNNIEFINIITFHKPGELVHTGSRRGGTPWITPFIGRQQTVYYTT